MTLLCLTKNQGFVLLHVGDDPAIAWFRIRICAEIDAQ